tara:strand:- start:61 stop:291 length:231 start_codon:yes stop_codon:yes gene_type:complete
MRTKITVDTHGCTFEYFKTLIHMFPKGAYSFPKDKTCFWFVYENFTFFLDSEYYEEWIEYNESIDDVIEYLGGEEE